MRPTAKHAGPEDHAEKFRYGHRWVDGEQVPLTLEDVLHPREGDAIPLSPSHQMTRASLAALLRTRPLAPPHVHITSDQLIDFEVAGIKAVSPDVGAFVGLREPPDLEAGTFYPKRVKARCLFLLEVVSPDTRVNDVEKKLDLYHRFKVPLYAIIDQRRQGGPRELLAFRRGVREYKPVTLEGGKLELPGTGLRLFLRDNRAVCEEIETGREVGDYGELMREKEALERRDTEREQEIEELVERAHQAESRLARQADEIAELREALRRVRGGPPG